MISVTFYIKTTTVDEAVDIFAEKGSHVLPLRTAVGNDLLPDAYE